MKKQTACPVCRGRGTITVITGNRNDICGVKNETCPSCGGTGMNMENVTNADRIREMNDEELREFLCQTTDCSVCAWGGYSGCELMKWLQQPVKEDS